MSINSIIYEVKQNIKERSLKTRLRYLKTIEHQAKKGKSRESLACGNLAHTVAASSTEEKRSILDFTKMNLAIITSYNDMVSAHTPYFDYPRIIKRSLSLLGNTAQVAGGVPAMCDGITQGNDGMELSLFSRDLIAQSTALSLSHNTYDGVLLLGVCDKIAPGQLIGALAFGHLPCAFVPSGPMRTGLSNTEKVATRQKFVTGELDSAALQKMECQAYHSSGTCTFYGTANTNQLVMEAMGLMLPGSAFVPPESALRDKLTEKISTHIATSGSAQYGNKALAKIVDEKAVINGLVALLASGGSTNHTIHLVATARAAGWIVTWDDIDTLSQVVPLLINVYPNGSADINAFHKAGGVPCLLNVLNQRNLIFMDANPVYGSMQDYLTIPYLNKDNQLCFSEPTNSKDESIIASHSTSFSTQGGLKVLSGNLGRGIMKVSAVDLANQNVTAPAKVFDSQHDVVNAYKEGSFKEDCVIVVRNNGPAANGMPELHKLMPIMGNLMKQGLKVALLTDGRLSGASGKVPAVIHITPESKRGGLISKLMNGDLIEINGQTGHVNVLVDISDRVPEPFDNERDLLGCGRELFNLYRKNISSAEEGASILF